MHTMHNALLLNLNQCYEYYCANFADIVCVIFIDAAEILA